MDTDIVIYFLWPDRQTSGHGEYERHEITLEDKYSKESIEEEIRSIAKNKLCSAPKAIYFKADDLDGTMITLDV